MRVLAAMSGGVDSAVAAARAVDAGHDVTGVHLALASNPQTLRTGARGCCTLEDSNDARRAADVLGIPFYIWDLADRFRADVVDDFVAEYAAGRTPNPCLRCNEKIKFSAVLDRALALGFDAVVTGHHARLEDGRLRRSVDAAKDQSYVLAVLTPEQLQHAVFPLGDTTKADVRAEAARRGLAVADKPDSHDICFIADGDTRGFLERSLGASDGAIVDAESGAVLGTHRGSYGFTVGQRRGLHLDRPAPDGEPRYVLSIRPKDNTVVVGPAALLDVDEIVAEHPVWTGTQPGESFDRGGRFDCLVQLRAHGMVSPATVRVEDGRVIAVLHTVQRGVAAGQALVLYREDEVLGSATIAEARTASVPRMTRPWSPGAVTGLGSLPGTDPAEAHKLVFGELAQLPHLVELPDRGAPADMIGRATAVLVDLPAEIVPSGWRLTARPGHDHRRARDLLARDLDALEEAADGWTGPLKVQVAGPWTLAASIELPNGHRVVSDRGATRDLAGSLAEGLREQLADLGRRVPGASLVVQFDEPSLPSVLAGTVPTPSGYGIVRAIEESVAEQTLADVFAVAPTAVAHCCAPGVPIALLRGAGAAAVAVDAALLTTKHNDAIGEAIEAGVSLWLGVIGSGARPDFRAARATIRGLWSQLGFPETQLAADLVPTPACGLAGSSPERVRSVFAVLRDLGRDLVDPVELS